MNTLDSRYVDMTSCFSHRFSSPGTFAYEVSPLPVSIGSVGVGDGDGDDDSDGIARVVVSDKPASRQQQHHVVIKRKHGGLVARPARLEIHRGDIVTWSTNGSAPLGFAVRGTIGDRVVDSAAMQDEALYTHAFGMPGDYRWVDAHGSGLHGTVRVVLPEQDERQLDAWRRSLEKGTLVTVEGDRAEPAEVEIQVGQTVAWSISKAPGVSITDVTLLHGRTQDATAE